MTSTIKGKCVWDSLYSNIHWESTWLLPYTFVIPNKLKELHFKILHSIYPTNKLVSRFAAVDNKCEFCKIEEETIIHLFWECRYSVEFWKNIENYLNIQKKHEIKLEAKYVILNYDNKNKTIHRIIIINPTREISYP